MAKNTFTGINQSISKKMYRNINLGRAVYKPRTDIYTFGVIHAVVFAQAMVASAKKLIYPFHLATAIARY